MDNDFTMGFFSSLCFRFSGTAQGEGPLVGEGEVMSGFMMEFLPMFFDVFLLGCFVWLYFRLVECVKLIDKAQKRAEDDLSVWSEDFSLQCNQLDGLLRMNKSKLDELTRRLNELELDLAAKIEGVVLANTQALNLRDQEIEELGIELKNIAEERKDDYEFVCQEFDGFRKEFDLVRDFMLDQTNLNDSLIKADEELEKNMSGIVQGSGVLEARFFSLEEKLGSLAESAEVESKGLSVEEQFGNLMSFQAYGSNK